MTERRERPVLVGESALHVPGPVAGGASVLRDGESYYAISNVDAMPPFLVSVVSGFDHWLFVSSAGGLTCGRRSPEHALFPYCTDDKVHDACHTTGPRTALLVTRDGATRLWQPFEPGASVYAVERNLYKNVTGNKLVFEEVNRDLGLTFAYTWATGNRFGFVRTSRLRNDAASDARVRILDGLRNLLPHGVDRGAQSELSTLVDAYKQAESVADACAAIYSLSSILTDRAEPSEALKATVAWSIGLDRARVLLSEDQVRAFCEGREVRAEATAKGKRGAFFVQAAVVLPPRAERRWIVVADVDQGPARVAALLHAIRGGVTEATLDRDVEDGTARLRRLAGAADAFQRSADDRVDGRHFANTLFNIMRGGVFPHGYRVPREDFLDFVASWNRPLRGAAEDALGTIEGPLTLHALRALAADGRDPTFTRLVHEYLPLTFGRRHGDPSRPWNHFSIELEKPDGSESLEYQGNWRDIFQNWEALALSFPEYIESFIAKFVNASTPDGYNPYRISRAGIDWETLEDGDSWSNIGYWGDHQVVYLLRLLDLSCDHHPGGLGPWLDRDLFVYADVPYRIAPYAEMLRDPRNTVAYDDDRAAAVDRRVSRIGADGKLVTLADGTIHRVNLLEKLLLVALVRIGNLAPGGGIWMNTQRPEWNDANNALVGHGLSMVTLCHLRRYLHRLGDLLRETPASSFPVSDELASYFEEVVGVLREHRGILDGPAGAADRKSFMDRMGAANDRYREGVYRGFGGAKRALASPDLQAFVDRALAFLDHGVAHGRRADGLYHAYNLVKFGAEGYDVEPLDEMLEGQVAVLSSGALDAGASLAVLEALRSSRLYRADQNSYLLYPDRALPSFLEKNVVPGELVRGNDWIARQLDAGRTGYVERDVDGNVHFHARFRNGSALRAALDADPEVAREDADRLCAVYEAVFAHRKFTGRSGSMFKYEGLGCIYWHMVSKLLLATAEAIEGAVDAGADRAVVERLRACFHEIRDGIGLHKSPAVYGAFPVDPYSHTPGFVGVQQPGLTGQVKEDVITRRWQLGVRVRHGEIAFEPLVLGRDELLGKPASWRYSDGGPEGIEDLPAGSLAFTLCGVPVVYRLADTGRVHVFGEDGDPAVLEGVRLGRELSRSLFRRERRIKKLVVELPESAFR